MLWAVLLISLRLRTKANDDTLNVKCKKHFGVCQGINFYIVFVTWQTAFKLLLNNYSLFSLFEQRYPFLRQNIKNIYYYLLSSIYYRWLKYIIFIRNELIISFMKQRNDPPQAKILGANLSKIYHNLLKNPPATSEAPFTSFQVKDKLYIHSNERWGASARDFRRLMRFTSKIFAFYFVMHS